MCWKCLWDVVEGFGSEADGRRLSYKDRQTQINILWHEAWDKADPIQQFKCYLRGQALQSDEAPGDDVQNSSCPSFSKIICVWMFVVWKFVVRNEVSRVYFYRKLGGLKQSFVNFIYFEKDAGW